MSNFFSKIKSLHSKWNQSSADTSSTKEKSKSKERPYIHLGFQLAQQYLVQHFTEHNIDTALIYRIKSMPIQMTFSAHSLLVSNKYDLHYSVMKKIRYIISLVSEDKDQYQLLVDIAMQPFENKSLKQSSQQLYTQYEKEKGYQGGREVFWQKMSYGSVNTKTKLVFPSGEKEPSKLEALVYPFFKKKTLSFRGGVS